MAIKHNPVATFNRIKDLPDCPPFVLVLCSDEVRKNRIVAAILDRFFSGKNGQKGFDAGTGSNRVDSSQLSREGLALLSEKVLAPSLFSPHQLFFIRNLDSLNSDLTRPFVKLLESLPPGINFVLTGRSLPSTSAILQFFSLRDLVIELPDLKGQELRRWTEKELRAAGLKSFSQPVPETLIRIADSSPDRIIKLVEHAALYCESGDLDLPSLRTLFLEQVEPDEFALIDAIQDRNPARPELLISQLLASGKSAFPILAIISRIFCNYLLIKLLAIRGKSPNDIKQELKMTSWVFSKNQAAAQRYPLPRLLEGLKAILRADSQLKHRSLGQEAILSELVNRLRV